MEAENNTAFTVKLRHCVAFCQDGEFTTWGASPYMAEQNLTTTNVSRCGTRRAREIDFLLLPTNWGDILFAILLAFLILHGPFKKNQNCCREPRCHQFSLIPRWYHFRLLSSGTWLENVEYIFTYKSALSRQRQHHW
jgi:hypothetical protein